MVYTNEWLWIIILIIVCKLAEFKTCLGALQHVSLLLLDFGSYATSNGAG